MQRRWQYRSIMAILATLSVTPSAQAGEMQLPDIRTQPTPQAVLDEHLDALNKCDWNRLVAQYPEDAQIHLLNGKIITGRKAIGELLVLTDELREAIVVKAPARKLKELAIAGGSRLMRTTALDLVEKGVTTLMEANRVTALA